MNETLLIWAACTLGGTVVGVLVFRALIALWCVACEMTEEDLNELD